MKCTTHADLDPESKHNSHMCDEHLLFLTHNKSTKRPQDAECLTVILCDFAFAVIQRSHAVKIEPFDHSSTNATQLSLYTKVPNSINIYRGPRALREHLNQRRIDHICR